MSATYRTLWISDIHLGTRAACAAELLVFLAQARAERIYLVGDIVDLERLRSRPRFPEEHLAVVAELVHIASRGTEVVFIPGNHDHEFRTLTGHEICGIPVAPEATHVTPSGKRLLVTHGDVLDGRIRKGSHLEKFGAAAYFLLVEADVLVNRLRRRLGRDRFPISSAVKRRLRSAEEYIRRFEIVAAAYAEERGFDGIVCGHIHRPGIRRIGGCLYANDGDWVEHRTALTETEDGTLAIVNWQLEPLHAQIPQKPVPPLAA